jgi:endonuclease/exonuclease/phosphatase family metal-dependent hydrolase
MELEPDVLVIQECENPETTSDKNYKDWAKNHVWIGANKNKGLGVFVNEKTTIKKYKWSSGGLKYFIPCKVNDTFNLVGAWCCNAPTFGYIGQFWKYLHLHRKKFDTCVLAGDFNSNVFWDKPKRVWNHSDVVRELKALNIESVYHKHHSEEQGKEQIPTFFLYKNLSKPYHLDYIFASNSLHRTVKEIVIGNPATWIEMSDHMPVLCEF